ncbi:MAG: ARPP-1 family domain-containing protein [Terracidiphilus sp.]
MKSSLRYLPAAVLFAVLAALAGSGFVTAAGGPNTGAGAYRVLAPIESGHLLLFPVVRTSGDTPAETPFITLDEGIKSGDVEVTEAGNVRGLVRPRPANGWHDPGIHPPPPTSYRGDQVNTLVLVNHSRKPLLLLAGEIVTGGKQDRVIAKDRIVPPDADPIDLSVFCIEPGRWTGSTDNFGASNKASAESFMVQPAVRERAMAEKDQQEVWNSVHGTISQMAAVAAPSSIGSASETVTVEAGSNPIPLNTSSYAQAMNNDAIKAKVDEAATPANEVRAQVLEKLREEHAVGVVVAVHGKLIWADLFANTDLLSRYWTKLVRSYAAESVTESGDHEAPGVADAQRFLESAATGHVTSEGDVGVYRYSELHGDRTETFILESLLPNTDYEVHISKMKLRDSGDRAWREAPVSPGPGLVPLEPIR